MSGWYLDQDFTTRLPEPLPDAVARCYGTGEMAVDFAQALAAFIAIPYGRAALLAALTGDATDAAVAEFFRPPDDVASREVEGRSWEHTPDDYARFWAGKAQ